MTSTEIDLKKKYSWITKEFFEDIITLSHVIEFELQPALKPGENYSNVILRAIVSYMDSDHNLKSKNFIFKLGENELLSEFNMFYKEINMNKNIFPLVHKLYSTIDEEIQLAPKFYPSPEKCAGLIMDDLCVDGYKNIDRKLGLDYAHMEIVLTKLAKFHAATALLGVNQVAQFLKPPLDKTQTTFFPLFLNALTDCASVACNWTGFEKIAEQLVEDKMKFINRICEDFTRNPNSFNVLSHGDLWANNIMFKHDRSGQPIDVLMVDFSVGYWTTPAFDLTYLFFTSSNDNLIPNDFQPLLKHYHKQLNSSLIALQYEKPIPTYEEIYSDFVEKCAYAISAAMLVVGLRYADDSIKADVAAFFGSTERDLEIRRALVSSPSYRTTMERLLTFYNENGMLKCK